MILVALITFGFLALIVFVYAIHYVSQSCGGIDAVKRKDRFLFMASWLNSFWMSFFYLWLILQPWPEVQISAGLHWIIFSIFAVEKLQTLHLCFHLNIQDNTGKRDLSHSKKKKHIESPLRYAQMISTSVAFILSKEPQYNILHLISLSSWYRCQKR